MLFGHYRLGDEIGAGGMGRVVRAEDERLGRQVAIKILPSDAAREPLALSRFQREARAIASLNHPHICTIHDVGEHEGQPFLVMELLDGTTLRTRLASGPPALDVALTWMAQISDALEAAHTRGIVHRDLKPENIIITSRGDAKILDFGIALLADDLAPDGQTRAPNQHTAPGTAVGTIAYMAPEQVRGDTIDRRADLFSLGVILYEALTGRNPFAGPTTGVIAEAILNRAPGTPTSAALALPPGLAPILDKLLEKDRELRYQHAADVRADLKRLLRQLSSAAVITPPRPVTVPAERSVAVLPFRNMSADPENAFFSDGIAEDLTGALGRIAGLRVASRASAFRFRDATGDLQAIGAALGVSAIVEGSVRRSGNRLRVTAQLVDPANGYQLWSERYDREMADVFDIQDEIVSSLVKALAPALLGDAKEAVRRPTENHEAYELYLKGRHYWHQRSPTTLKLAIHCFERAVSLDPDFALAYSGLADSWGLYRPYGWLPAHVGRPPAQAAIDRAMALAPNLAEVQFSKALHVFYFDFNWRPAIDHFRRAIELNPRWSWAQAYCAVALAAADPKAHAEEIERCIRNAVELDPLSPFVHAIVAIALRSARQPDRALASARRALELQPDYLLGLWVLAITLDDGGQSPEAVEYMARATTGSGRAPIFVALLATIYAKLGRMDQCDELETELNERALRGEYLPPVAPLLIAIARSDRKAIVKQLLACIEDGTHWFTVGTTIGPRLDTFLDDPEIAAIAKRLHSGV